MKRSAIVVRLLVSAAGFAGCASHGSDTDSESHFYRCVEDGDCRNAHGRTICVERYCEFPNVMQTLVEEPGPAADCTSEWPATTLRFETAETEAYQSYDGGAHAPRLNRNGTVIVGVTSATSGSASHLIRWTGQTVSRIDPPGQEAMLPRAVSCDGLTIVGTIGSAGLRWTGGGGFEPLPGFPVSPSPGEYRPMAISADASAVLGVYRAESNAPLSAVRWLEGNVSTLFSLESTGNPTPIGWSGDGSTLVWYSDNGVYTQTPDAEWGATLLPTQLALHAGWGAAVSFDGKVVAGVHTDTRARYVWSDAHQLENLPDGATIYGVTPDGVAVGSVAWSEGIDSDLVWDRVHGPRRLRDILASQGLVLPEKTMIDECTDISADGRVITGISVDYRGTQIFRAIVPAGTFD